MALIDMNFSIDRLTVLFDKAVPVERLNGGQITFHINDKNGNPDLVIWNSQFAALPEGDRIVILAVPESLLYRLFRSFDSAQVGFFVDNQFLHGEKISLTRAALESGFDPLAMNIRRRKMPDKPAKVAVMTQAYNEGPMLAYWETYWGNLLGYENVYVLNNAGTDASCATLNPKTTVVNMPAAPVDHDHFAQAQGYFQRFLLLKYDWVVRVDADELLVCEGNLVDKLAGTPPGTYLPEIALDIVHDASTEAPFDFARPICVQRSHFVRADPLLIRPVISSVPTTWSPGNHHAMEFCSVLPGLFEIHLRCFDFDFLLNKITKWSKMKQTESDELTCRHVISTRSLGEQDLHNKAVAEIAERLSAEAVAVPGWFLAQV
jgi:hypothetical protein